MFLHAAKGVSGIPKPFQMSKSLEKSVKNKRGGITQTIRVQQRFKELRRQVQRAINDDSHEECVGGFEIAVFGEDVEEDGVCFEGVGIWVVFVDPIRES